MAETLYIEKNPEPRASMDYRGLKAEGIRHIERLARDVWTDYNVHDPGITMLELLCYAITDLGYRTDHPVKDLLTRYADGEQHTLGRFHQAREVLTCRPVTFADLRKLLIDIDGVRNAWIEKHESIVYCLDRNGGVLQECPPVLGPHQDANPPLNGLYDVYIDLEEEVREEEAERHAVVMGLVDGDVGRGRFVEPSTRGILFDVQHELTIEAVHVYAEAPGRVQVRLLDEAESELNRRVVAVEDAQKKIRIPLGFAVGPGKNYRLDARGSEVRLFRSEDVQYDFEVENLIRLTSGVHGSRAIDPYYFFYAWEVTYAVPSGAPAHERAKLGRPDNVGAPGAYIHPEGKGLLFEVLSDLTVEQVSVYADRPGTVEVIILDDEGRDVARAEAEVMAAGVKTPIDLDVDLAGGREYRIVGGPTEVELYRNTVIDFPFSAAGAIQLVEGLPGAHRYYFFYDWIIAYSPPEVEASGRLRADVFAQVKQRLLANRNLGEDFVDICPLEKEEVAVCADIEVTPDTDIEEALAEMMHRLGQFITPPVRFYTLQEMLGKGRSPTDIFEGPMLTHGFIDNREFQQIQRRRELHVSDLVQEVMDVAGVTAVREISLISFLEDTLHRQEEWILPLQSGRIAEFETERSKIIFYKNGLPYYANREKVNELLQERKLEDVPPTARGRTDNFPVPVGEDRRVEEYYPVQNEMPATYMVGNHRVPSSESPRRKAQSRQLKAYLMFFEQLLANYLSQLANVHELFSWEAGPTQTYFTQQVTGIADVEELYVGMEDFPYPDLRRALEAIVEAKATSLERKNRFLEHLISRFAESFSEYGLLMYSHYRGTAGGREAGDSHRNVAAQRLIGDRRAFLKDYSQLSSGRGMAFNYARPDRFDNLSGYQARVYRLLGFQEVQRQNLAGHLFSIEDEEVEDEEESDVRREWWFELQSEQGDLLFESIRCRDKSSITVLLDTALELGEKASNYRLVEEGDAHELYRPCRGDGEGDPIGATTSRDVLDEVRAYFRKYARSEGFHVVEHVLLRKRTQADPFLPVQLADEATCDCPEVRDPYSFRVSVLLPSWPKRLQDLKFRAFVEKTLRMEAPAHVYVRICWVSHEQMKQFEVRYNAWLENLAGLTRWMGRCPGEAAASDGMAPSMSGELPLPAIADAGEGADHPLALRLQGYRDSLEALIRMLHALDNVHPLVRLHDCSQAADSETPQVTLNNANLGTF